MCNFAEQIDFLVCLNCIKIKKYVSEQKAED